MYCPARWIQSKVGSFDRSSLKSKALRFLKKNPPVPHVVRSFKVKRHLAQCTAVGNSEMNLQWRAQISQQPFIYYRQLLVTAL